MRKCLADNNNRLLPQANVIQKEWHPTRLLAMLSCLIVVFEIKIITSIIGTELVTLRN